MGRMPTVPVDARSSRTAIHSGAWSVRERGQRAYDGRQTEVQFALAPARIATQLVRLVALVRLCQTELDAQYWRSNQRPIERRCHDGAPKRGRACCAGTPYVLVHKTGFSPGSGRARAHSRSPRRAEIPRRLAERVPTVSDRRNQCIRTGTLCPRSTHRPVGMHHEPRRAGGNP